MKFIELFQKFLDGEIQMDLCGHENDWFLERQKEHFKHNVSMSQGGNDGKWSDRGNQSVEEVDADMREHYLRPLNQEITDGYIFKYDWYFTEFRCACCGKRLFFQYKDNKFILNHVFNYRNERGHFDEVPRCEYSDVEVLKSSINVTSPMVIVNAFFKDDNYLFVDSPEDKKYSDSYSLCNMRGRDNIQKYKAKECNCLTGQMGNMSIGIFVSKDKKSIIIGDTMKCDKNGEYHGAENKVIKGHKKVGEISLCVWRWEATDKNTLEKVGYDVDNQRERDIVVIDVAPGTWELEHYYPNNKETDPIYSRITLKQ
jgi:hypothetical protein